VVVFPDVKQNLITLVAPSRNFLHTKQIHAYFDDDKTTTDITETRVRSEPYTILLICLQNAQKKLVSLLLLDTLCTILMFSFYVFVLFC